MHHYPWSLNISIANILALDQQGTEAVGNQSIWRYRELASLVPFIRRAALTCADLPTRSLLPASLKAATPAASAQMHRYGRIRASFRTTLLLSIAAALAAGCATSREATLESGQTITASMRMTGNEAFGLKAYHCQGFLRQPSVQRDFIRRNNKEKDYQVALRYDKSLAEQIEQEARQSALTAAAIDDPTPIFAIEQTVLLDGWDEANGAFPVNNALTAPTLVDRHRIRFDQSPVDPLLVGDYPDTEFRSVRGLAPGANGMPVGTTDVVGVSAASVSVSVLMSPAADQEQNIWYNPKAGRTFVRVPSDVRARLVKDAIDNQRPISVGVVAYYEIDGCGYRGEHVGYQGGKKSGLYTLQGEMVRVEVYERVFSPGLFAAAVVFSGAGRPGQKPDARVNGPQIAHWERSASAN